MPWTTEDVDRFKKGLNKTQKNRWVKIANSALNTCVDEGERSKLECEISAIKIANAKFSESSYSLPDNVCPVIPGAFKKQKLQEIILQEAELTDDYQMILPVGLFHSKWYGEIIITKSYCEAMRDNWADKVMGEREPFIDTEHDRGEANGWIKDLQARDDGLYAKIEWTEKGEENVGGGLFKYFSADIDSMIDIETGEEHYPVLVAVALCNCPVMTTMPQVHLSEKDQGVVKRLDEAILKLSGKNSTHSDGVKHKSKEQDAMITKEELLKAFAELSQEDKIEVATAFSEALKGDGKSTKDQNTKTSEAKLSDGEGTEGKNDTKVDALIKQNQQLSEQLAKLADDKKDEGKSKITYADPVIGAKIEALEKANKQLAEQITLIVGRDRAKRKEVVIGKALSEGRIYPKDKDFWADKFEKDPDGTTEVLQRMPSLNIFSEEGTGSDGKPFILNETKADKKLREGLGISVEDSEKYGG